MKDLTEIAKDSHDSYYYAKSLNFQNVPDIIIKSVSNNVAFSSYYLISLNNKNVPLIILKTISSLSKYHYLFNQLIGFSPKVNFLLYIFKYDKRTIIII